MDFAGKVALISGGAEGIGGTVARLFVAAGGSVVLGDVQVAKAEALAAELGSHAAAVKLDVAALADWQVAVAATQSRFGKLTHLFNIAGISEPGTVEDVDLSSWSRHMAINLDGTMFGCRTAIPAMVASGEECAIVNTGSMLAMRPGPMFLSYCASKSAVTALSKCVALHCAGQGYRIRCNTVHPGAIETPMYHRYLDAFPGERADGVAMFAANHPMGRVGLPEEVAKAMLFLASDDASFTTGVDFTVDGGGNFRA